MSYDKIVQMFADNKVDTEFTPRQPGELFARCVRNADSVFFAWFCENFGQFIPRENYDLLYEQAMIDRITIVERIIPHLTGTHVPSRRQLVQRSLSIVPSSLVSNQELCDYVIWLVNMGRSRVLQTDTARRIITLLMREQINHNVLRQFVQSILLVERYGALVRMIQDLPSDITRGLCQIAQLVNSKKLMLYDKTTSRSISRFCMTIFSFAVESLRYQKFALEMIQEKIFIPALFSRHVKQDMLEEFCCLALNHGDPELIQVLDKEMRHPDLLPASRETYIRSLNATLIDKATDVPEDRFMTAGQLFEYEERVVFLLKILQSDTNIFHDSLTRVVGLTRSTGITEFILNEIDKRLATLADDREAYVSLLSVEDEKTKVDALKSLGDYYISLHIDDKMGKIKLVHPLARFTHLAGRKSHSALLELKDWHDYTAKRIVFDLAEKYPEVYLKKLITELAVDGDKLTWLFSHPMYFGKIGRFDSNLNMGKRTYSSVRALSTGSVLLQESKMPRRVACADCKGILTQSHTSRNCPTIYYCKECAERRQKNQYQSNWYRPTKCSVCQDTRDIIILECQHAICSVCYESGRRQSCSVCLKCLFPLRNEISAEKAIEIFLTEIH